MKLTDINATSNGQEVCNGGLGLKVTSAYYGPAVLERQKLIVVFGSATGKRSS